MNHVELCSMQYTKTAFLRLSECLKTIINPVKRVTTITFRYVVFFVLGKRAESTLVPVHTSVLLIRI